MQMESEFISKTRREIALKKAKIRTLKSKYEAIRLAKRVSFNKKTESELLNYANKLNFSEWAKKKLKEDIEEDHKKEGAEKVIL